MTRKEPELFEDRERMMMVMHNLNNYIDYLKQEINDLQDSVSVLDGRMQSLIIQFELMKSGKGASDKGLTPIPSQEKMKNEEAPPESVVKSLCNVGKYLKETEVVKQKKPKKKVRGSPKKDLGLFGDPPDCYWRKP